jgi:hypothetical protein
MSGDRGTLPSWPIVRLGLPVSYNHHTEADFAASELARMFAGDRSLCYAAEPAPAAISSSASYEGSSPRAGVTSFAGAS